MDEAVLQRVVDQAAVRDLMQGISRALDTHDGKAFGDLFTEDAAIEIRGHTVQGRDALVAGLQGRQEKWEVTFHHVGQVYVDVQGDEATATAYTVAYHLEKAGDPMKGPDSGGFQEARARRTPDGWRLTWLSIRLVMGS